MQRISEQVACFFDRYAWPGNVRELEHAIEAGLHMARGTELRLEDLPAHLQRSATASGIVQTQPEPQPSQAAVAVNPRELRGSLVNLEREAVLNALEQCKWNMSRASSLLGIPRQTLQYRLKVLGLMRPKEG